MLTSKELSYVTKKAQEVPFPGIKYANDALERLIKSVEDYEKFYKNREYDLILSNGEQIEFEILTKNLCHMLGIDFKNLCTADHQQFREEILGIEGLTNSYELLTKLCEKIDDVLKYDCDNTKNIINYYRVMVKCAIFQKLSDFSKFNFGVINFDKDIYVKKSSSYYSGNSEKFLYVQSNEQYCPYFMMGILPNKKMDEKTTKATGDKEQNKYAVETLIAPTNAQDFFNEQNTAIPTQIIVTTKEYMNKFVATPSEKIALLNQYRAIIAEYRINYMMNTNGDYFALLKQQESDLETKLVRK